MVIDELEEKLLAQLRELPLAEQQRVLEFANSLGHVSAQQSPRPSVYGLLKDHKIDLSFEDFKELRKEMWANFPRDFPGDKD